MAFEVPSGLQYKLRRPLKLLEIPENIPTFIREMMDLQEPVVIDDYSYVSRVAICRADSSAEMISGVKMTFTNTRDNAETEEPLEGYSGSQCPLDKVIELNATDCITRFNVVFDQLGNGHSIIYRRREGEAEETIGFGNVTTADFSTDDVPASGCLSGYNFGFDSPIIDASGRRLASDSEVSMQGAYTVSNEGAETDLEMAEITL